MITRAISWTLMALCCAAGVAGAQQAAPPTAPAVKSTPQAEAGEPRADSSSPAAVPDRTSPSSSAAAAPSTGHASASVDTGGRASAPAQSVPSEASSGQPGAAAAAQKSATKVDRTMVDRTKVDRLDLGTATVTGDREQPKVMYIVPWKRSDIGDLAGKPMNSLVDEILAPVDRDVFKREVVYYQAVQADASQNGAQPKAGPQGEK